MLDHIHPERLICIDIETVPGYADFSFVPNVLKELYLLKSARLKKEEETEAEQYFNHAGIYAEFGKIVCISIGIFAPKKHRGVEKFRIKSFAGNDEKLILQGFCDLLNGHYHSDKYAFCGHNIREFDIPY